MAAGAHLRGDVEAAPALVTPTPECDAAPQPTKADRIVAALRRAGADRMTVHQLEAMAKQARWPGQWKHGLLSGVLPRDVVRRGLAVRTQTYRDGAAVHLAAEHA
jgi:hypothetical protein